MQNRLNIPFFKTTGVLVDVFEPALRPLWAVLTVRMSLKSLKSQRFWDHKRMKNGPRIWFSDCALGSTGMPTNMLLARLAALLGSLDTLDVPNLFERAKIETCIEICQTKKELAKRPGSAPGMKLKLASKYTTEEQKNMGPNAK